MWERIKHLIRKEFLQTLRNPRMRVLLFAPPLVQLIIFGYAVNLDVERSPIAWVDFDQTPRSRELRAEFEGSSYFLVRDAPDGKALAQQMLDRGEVLGIVRVLPGFGRRIARADESAVQILVDGTNSNTASIVSAYAGQIVSRHAARALSSRRNPAGIELEARVWFNPNLVSRIYFVPGVVVNIIALVTVMLTAMSIVREKEIGTMEQLMVTPLRPIELMLGKMIPFAVIGLAEVGLVTTAALVVFRIPFRGSVGVLFGCSALFLLTTLGIGLFISTISRTQQQAMMASFFFFLPALLLSGFVFPIRNMPPAVQLVTFLNPLRYFMEIARGVFLKGSGGEYLWPQMAALLILGAAVLTLSALRFRKRLD